MTTDLDMPKTIAADNHQAVFAWLMATLDDLDRRSHALHELITSAQRHQLGHDAALPAGPDLVVVVLDRAVWVAAANTATTPLPSPPEIAR